MILCTSSTIQETVQKLNQLGQLTKRLTLNWIKARKGHEGNEIADRLANLGARATSEHKYVQISDTLIKTYINNCIYDSWSLRWKKDINKNKHTKHFFPTPNTRLSKRLLKFDRSELTLIISAISGHNYLRQFSNKISPLNNTKCRLCQNEPKTLLHLINSCDIMSTHRVEIFNFFKFEGKNTNWNPVKLQRFLNLPTLQTLFKPGDLE